MTRALTAMERGLWKTDLAAPLNFTTVARISGPLDSQQLRDALPAVRARHPHLRERIADGRFVTDAVPALALDESSKPWVEALEDELNGPLTAPLARFVRTGEHLLVTLHHSVGDGMSGVFLLRDWLKAATGTTLEPLTDPGGIDTLLPPAPGLPNHARFMANDAWLTVRHGKSLKLRRDLDKPAYERRARVLPFELDADLVTRLHARARAEKTTVHGALSAAMLLGLLADAGRDSAAVMFGSPVNVRASLQPQVGEGLGFYVSMLGFRAAVRATDSFWDLARAVRRALEADLARKAELSMLRLVPTLYGLLGGDRMTSRVLVERWEKYVRTTSGLTNLGRLAVETRFGPLTLEACHFAASPSALGDFLATATSLHGRLNWNFIWPDPVITEAHARALVGDIVSRLSAGLK